MNNYFNNIKMNLTPYQILVVGFAVLILGGTFLLMTPMASTTGVGLSFVNALFTATSAVCVTGLVVVDTGTYFSLFGQLVIVLLIQTGGLGFMTMTTLFMLMLRKRVNLRERLIMQEALNQVTMAGVVRLTVNIIKMTLTIEFIGGTILAIRWYVDYGLRGIYWGYWHAVSAFCNAGFDLFGHFHSITAYAEDVTVNLVVSSLILLGGIGFSVMSDIWQNKYFKKFSLHTKTVLITSASLVLLAMLVILLLEYNNPATLAALSWKGKLLGSYFQAVTPRTAGFNTIEIGKFKDATLFFILILMFIGASPTSTGGGVKTSTFALLVLALWSLIRGKNEAVLFNRSISTKVIYKAFGVVFISGLLVIIITMALSITEQASFLAIMFEATSAFGTVGLSTGITPTLSPVGKYLIIVTMFAGRVGPLTLAFAFALKQKKASIQYPEGKIMIG